MTEAKNLVDYMNLVISKYGVIKPNEFYEVDKIFFRGQQKKEYDLVPSVGRRISKKEEVSFIRFEGKMIESAKLQHPEMFDNDYYPINILAKLQHYGIPTRLLDVTENALVALYFACNGLYDYDGKVYCFKKNQNDVSTSFAFRSNLIASMSNYSVYTSYDLAEFWKDEKFEKYVHKNLRNTDEERVLDDLKNTLSRPKFVIPQMITEREKRQLSAFILYPNKIVDGVMYNELNLDNNFIDYEIIIPSKNKKKLLNELGMFGITEQFLFPEVEKKFKAIKNQTIELVDLKNYDKDQFM